MIRKLLTPLLFALAVFAGWHSACAQMAGERGNGYVDMQRPVNWDSPLNRGLVSWWVVLPDTNRGAVTFRDIAGTNHGTLTGMDPATDWVGSTRRGGYGALDLDGVNDNVLFTSPVASVPPVTLVAWLRTSSSSNQAVVTLSSSNGTYAGIGINSLAIYAFFNSASSGNVNATSTGTVTSGAWTMAAGVWNSGGTHAAFRDGANKGTASVSYTPSTPNGYIGAFNNFNSWASGQVDCVRIYKRALSDAEIFALYLEDLTGNPQTLSWVDYGGEYYEDAAPASGIVPFIITTQRKPTTRDRDRQKFYAAIGLASDQEWGLSP